MKVKGKRDKSIFIELIESKLEDSHPISAVKVFSDSIHTSCHIVYHVLLGSVLT